MGGAGDGFKTNDEAGAVVIFEDCRAWYCSDDGFDPSGPNTVVISGCWSFDNGRLDGDGTGFKTGAVTVDNTGFISRTINNCIAATNRDRGFMLLEYPDYFRTNARFYNNNSFRNNNGFTISNNALHPEVLAVWKNNISYMDNAVFSNAYQEYTESNNTWDRVDGFPGYVPASGINVTNDDFLSLDMDELKKPRKPEGSLPDINFMKLSQQSDLIDKGINVGLPFLGISPDIGAIEIK